MFDTPSFPELSPAVTEERTHFDLVELAAAIKADYAIFEKAGTDALKAGRRIGAHLCDAKKRLEHGMFVNWVKRHCPFDVRQGQRYMAMWKARIAGDTLPEVQDKLTHALAADEDETGAAVAVEKPKAKKPKVSTTPQGMRAKGDQPFDLNGFNRRFDKLCGLLDAFFSDFGVVIAGRNDEAKAKVAGWYRTAADMIQQAQTTYSQMREMGAKGEANKLNPVTFDLDASVLAACERLRMLLLRAGKSHLVDSILEVEGRLLGREP